jgi:NADH-quinone oxidoreductase subunit G
MIIGSNPRHEAPVLNARIRKRWLHGGFKIGVIGKGGSPMTIPTSAPGLKRSRISPSIRSKMENPMFIIGQVLSRVRDGLAILALGEAAVSSGRGTAGTVSPSFIPPPPASAL